MKRISSIVLIVLLCLSLFAGCKTETTPATSSATSSATPSEDGAIYPLPETLDVNALENCTVAVSLNEGDAYVDDSGKMVMNLTVYTYDLYDMVDIASLKENDVIVRKNEKVKVTEIERLDSGLIHINGGEENGGFDLASNDDTVYYEMGMNDIKAYYELGKVTLPVSDEFEYIDQSDLDSKAKHYYPGDFLTDVEGIEYNFHPNNTSIVIENGTIIKMNKVYMP